nr:hypothetical protein [uncultured Brevundimonas sp.]
MRNLSIAAVVLLTAAACSQSPAEGAPIDDPVAPAFAETAPAPVPAQPTPLKAAAKQAKPVALFERSEPTRASMELMPEGGLLRVVFRAAPPRNSALTPGDCELQAVGSQDADDVITARLVPFDGDQNVLTAADIGPNPPIIQVRVGPEGIFVTDSDAASRFCGLGSDIDGFYRRTGADD